MFLLFNRLMHENNKGSGLEFIVLIVKFVLMVYSDQSLYFLYRKYHLLQLVLLTSVISLFLLFIFEQCCMLNDYHVIMECVTSRGY